MVRERRWRRGDSGKAFGGEKVTLPSLETRLKADVAAVWERLIPSRWRGVMLMTESVDSSSSLKDAIGFGLDWLL